MDKLFRIKENNSTVKTEIAAGITSFFAMAYIIFVNPDQVAAGGADGWLAHQGADSAALGRIWNAVFISSIIVAIIGTLLYAFYAKLPYAQACGMGLNTFFCTCFVSGAYYNKVNIIDGYHSGLVIIFISGIVFFILSVTGVAAYVSKKIPDCLKKAIPSGIGLFIALIGLKSAGIIQTNEFTLVQLLDVNGAINDGTFMQVVVPAIVAFLGLLIIAMLGILKIKGNVIIGIIASTFVYYFLTGTLPQIDFQSSEQAFYDFAQVGLGGLFSAGAWKGAFTGANIGGILDAVVLIVTFCLIDMFDTLGTLYGTAAEADMTDENGSPKGIGKAMVSDSAATVCGSLLGTSTCTTFIESSAGVAAGGKTGLTALVTALCFLLCLFISPIASIIPPAATASALFYVGILMAKSFVKVKMDNLQYAVPSFVALIMIPLTYSISNGIGLAAISYVIITACTGKYKKDDIVITVIAALFILKFIFVTT